jgi:hypothetical protein
MTTSNETIRKTIDRSRIRFAALRQQVINEQALERNDFKYDRFPVNQNPLKLGDAHRIINEMSDQILLPWLTVYAKAIDDGDLDAAEKRSKAGTGFWQLVFIGKNQQDPGRQAIKNLFASDVGILKILPDVDGYRVEPPERKSGEGRDEYETRKKRWERSRMMYFPYWVTAPSPSWMTWDLGPNQPRWVTETARRWAYEVKQEVELLGGSVPSDFNEDGEVDIEEWWDDDTYAIFEAGKTEPLIKQPCKFGIPYAIKTGGQGFWGDDSRPENIIRGMLTQQRSAIIERSRQYAWAKLIVETLTMPSLRVNDPNFTNLRPGSGDTQYVPDTVVLDALVNLPVSPDIWRLMEWQRGELERDTVPSAIAGIRQPGTSSAAEAEIQQQQIRQLILSVKMAAQGLFQEGTAIFLRSIDEVFPNGVRVYGRTPYGHDIDQMITSEDVNGAYAVEIELFAGPPEQLDRLRAAALSEWERGAISHETALRNGRVQDPLSEIRKRQAEDMFNSPESQAQRSRAAAILNERYMAAHALVVGRRSVAARRGRNGNGTAMTEAELAGTPTFPVPGSVQAEQETQNELARAMAGTTQNQQRYVP